MKKLDLFLIGIVFILLLSVNPVKSNPYSVEIGDKYTYSLQSRTHSGEFTVEITDIVPLTNEEDSIGENTQVLGNIIGEHANEIVTAEYRWGYNDFPYSENSFQLSAISGQLGYLNSLPQPNRDLHLFNLIYEDIFPMVWPISTGFYEDWANESEFISVTIDFQIITIVEIVDETSYDGCLCETVIEVENGLARRIFQNETYSFAERDYPTPRETQIELLSPVFQNPLPASSIQFVLVPIILLSVIRMSKKHH